MKQGCVQSVVSGAVTVGDGLLLQDPQKETGLWFGVPTDFGDTLPATEGVGLRMIDPQGVSGLILGMPPYEVVSPIPVEPPTINLAVATGTTTISVRFTDNQTVAADSFNVKVEHADTATQIQDNNTTNNPYIITGLTASTLYIITMTATVGAVTSGISDFKLVTTSATEVPGDLIPLRFLQMEGTVGQNLSGADFMWNSGNTTYSADQVKYGTTSARMYIAEGSNGDASWGGGVSFPSAPIISGDEVWSSCWIYVPTDFIINNRGTHQMKWQRWKKRAVSGVSNGFVDLYIDGPAYQNTYSILAEISDPAHTKITTQADHPWQTGTWQRWEWYVKLSHNSDGKALLWKNGILVGERLNFKAFSNDSDWIEDFFYFTYFNDLSPQDQHVYVDNWVLATSANPPTETDAAGNRMIGNYTG